MDENYNLKICITTLFVILVCVFPLMADTADIVKVDEPLETEYRPPMAPEDIKPTYRPPMAPEDIEGELNGR